MHVNQLGMSEPGKRSQVGFYAPPVETLREIAGKARPMVSGEFRRIPERELSLEELSRTLNALLAGDAELCRSVLERSARLRNALFGQWVVPMAPVEIANTCSSDCIFCGWRVSNRAMKRMRISMELAMLQVDYLLDLGIQYIEFVSGDDIRVVRDLLPDLIRATRRKFDERGIEGKVSFCTLALTEAQYRTLGEAGADNMIVWQETYDPAVFRKHIVGGPKAFGIGEDWKVRHGEDGCRFRIESQERALRAGLEVALGSMLGLNPDITTEFLATVDHARYLLEHYDITPRHPLIIGMPIWNAITTRETDLRPGSAPDLEKLFPALAALYLLALPSDAVWIFPNCRVPVGTQIAAAGVAGAFSSTEVKLGPAGYLPSIIRDRRKRGESVDDLLAQIRELLHEDPGTLEQVEQSLNQREQFVHHYHSHASYVEHMSRRGLKLVQGVRIPDEREEEEHLPDAFSSGM